MTYDRQITLSTGGSRKAKLWQRQTLWWSELCARLQSPARGAETMTEYLSLSKAHQDELKDVGGFVAGALRDGRRKAHCVAWRDIVTLDLDRIGPGQTQAVLTRVEALGCGYAVYSTRKHAMHAPRLRVLLPLSRSCTADEYEPLARKMAELIGIDLCDPTTFEASRLMYWPSCCADGEYVFASADKGFADVDGVLSMYPDWRNVASWAQVPGTTPVQKLTAKQGDPTNKTGVVGAFCRTYDVPSAMEEYLQGAYDLCDIADNRYTFTRGSTAGGAVLYDDGKFLFSHHATDPAGGRLVNAFDLVRLHLYGDLDDEAKEGTPIHRLPSFKAMADRAEADPTVRGILERERGEMIVADFEHLTPGALTPGTGAEGNRVSLAEFVGSIEDKPATTGMVRELLHAMGITIKLNEITRNAEIAGCPDSWSRENSENNLPVMLRDILVTAGAKGATKGTICDSLDVIADENRYNPVRDLCTSGAWDGRDRLPELYAIAGIYDPFDRLLVSKWLHQCIAMALNNEEEPYGADGVLVLVGAQGAGKTSFFLQLSPFRRLVKDGLGFDPEKIDTAIRLLGYWISEFGELDRTTRKDSSALKAFITAPDDTYRTPYARKAVQRVRRTSLGGTVNGDSFLTDETGSRRFWAVKAGAIDTDRLFALSAEWKEQLWLQVYQTYLADPQGFRLTKDEHKVLGERNTEFDAPLDYELEIRALFDPSLPVEQWGWFTATEIAGKLLSRPPANRLGRALTKFARSDKRFAKRISRGYSVYMLPIKSSEVVGTNAKIGGVE